MNGEVRRNGFSYTSGSKTPLHLIMRLSFISVNDNPENFSAFNNLRFAAVNQARRNIKLA